jgi:hypothetical protein
MANFTEVTDAVLKQARQDPAVRRKLISDNLQFLLNRLNKMRTSNRSLDKAFVCEIRDTADMAVKLADLLQAANGLNISRWAQ